MPGLLDKTNERERPRMSVVWHDAEAEKSTNDLSDPLPEISDDIAMASDLKDLEHMIKQQYLDALNAKSEGEVAALIADYDEAELHELKKALEEAGVDFESSSIYAAADAAERRRLLAEARAKLEAQQNLQLDSKLENTPK